MLGGKSWCEPKATAFPVTLVAFTTEKAEGGQPFCNTIDKLILGSSSGRPFYNTAAKIFQLACPEHGDTGFELGCPFFVEA